MHRNNKGEARGRSRHKKTSKRVKKEHEHYKGKSPKQDLTSAKDLSIELSEGRESTID